MNREMRRLQEAEERRRKKAEESGLSRAQRRAAALQARSERGERKPFFRRVADYLHEVRVEMRKVTWPNRDQMVAFTTVTMITTIILTAVVFGLDVVAKQAVIWLIERGT
jgi:preprotein translocase subunit SecE